MSIKGATSSFTMFREFRDLAAELQAENLEQQHANIEEHTDKQKSTMKIGWTDVLSIGLQMVGSLIPGGSEVSKGLKIAKQAVQVGQGAVQLGNMVEDNKEQKMLADAREKYEKSQASLSSLSGTFNQFEELTKEASREALRRA